jgi:hypothetical protein
MSIEGKSVRTNGSELNLRDYDDQFSSYWAADVSLVELLETVDELRTPPSESKVVLDDGDSVEKTDYDSLRESEYTAAPPFVAVYADDYVLTWEEKGDSTQVGVRSDQDDLHEFAVEVFESTTATDVSQDDYEVIEDFVA